MRRALIFLAIVGCGGASRYDTTTSAWTRRTVLHGEYQEVLDLAAVFKSEDWRIAHAERDADHRNLTGPEREAAIAQAKADMAGPYEVELLVTTWDRRENDLDRGKKSVWRVVLVDGQGHEIEPLEIIKDKRPTFTLRAEFPALEDFGIAYVARFPRCAAVNAEIVDEDVGAGSGSGSGSAKPPMRKCKTDVDPHELRLRMSSERGGVEIAWSK